MNLLNIVIVVVLIAAFVTLISPPLTRNRGWSATVTPLASIIGSGFLVSVPLMASSIGIWAVAAVMTLTVLAYFIGGAIRYNIAYGEPEFADHSDGRITQSVEVTSHLVLIGAYFISVSYYLVLLGAFLLELVGWDEPRVGKLIATVLVGAICLVGATKGLDGVQRAERYTVSANLAVIASLLTALVIFGLNLPSGYSWSAELQQHKTIDLHTVRFLMGLLIVVQGFETSRFMGDLYGPQTRIKAMRRSQIISSMVYVTFFVLMIPLYPYFKSATNVAGFIGVIGRVTVILPAIVTAGAVASQFSAAVADSIGNSGLISETTAKRLPPKHAYLVIGAVSLIVIWATNVVSIVALASRAFALFYALQCVVAALLAHQRHDTRRVIWYATLAALAFAIAVLGIPAGG